MANRKELQNAQSTSLFGFEPVVLALRGANAGKFGLSIKLLTITRDLREPLETMVPFSEVFGSERSADIYAHNWVARESMRHLEA